MNELLGKKLLSLKRNTVELDENKDSILIPLMGLYEKQNEELQELAKITDYS